MFNTAQFRGGSTVKRPGTMNEFSDNNLKNEYLSRLNRTIDYIHSHSHEDLSLEKLADVACFSKFHFHRIFKAIQGETVNEFVQRIRLEKAWAQLMLHRYKPITDIALDTGFSSSQNFARSFKAQYGITPSQARAEYNYDTWLKKMQAVDGRSIDELPPNELAAVNDYILQLKLSLENRLSTSPKMQVTIQKFPPYRVAYIRNWGDNSLEALEALFTRLRQWADSRGYVNDDTVVMGVAWNNAYITPPEKLIYDVCITVPESTVADRWVNVQSFPGGNFAVHRCDIDVHHHEEEWLNFVLNWLAKSDYQPDDRPTYSIYYDYPEPSATERVLVDLCLPIKPLMR
jgi:AraC family transcriptional regulator